MATTRKKIINLQHFAVVSGEETYYFDLPNGACQLDLEIRSTHAVQLYLCGDETTIPWERGLRICERIYLSDLDSVRIDADQEAEIAVRLDYVGMRLEDELDDRPSEVSVPVPVQLTIHDLINQAISQRLAEQDEDEEEDDFEEYVDNLPDDIDTEFGPGKAEVPVYEPKKRSRRSGGGGNADGVQHGNVPDGNGAAAGAQNHVGTSPGSAGADPVKA